MEELTIANFIQGYEDGYITDVIVVKDKIYGKDPRGMAEQSKRYKVVFAVIP